ncbi:MAG: hypothetical protein ACI90V_012770 [Bacillariaceae sp.]|jgi:hypothetical protein
MMTILMTTMMTMTVLSFRKIDNQNKQLNSSILNSISMRSK